MKKALFYLIFAALVTVVAFGCGGGGGGDSELSGNGSDISIANLTGITDSTGVVEFSFSVENGVTAVQLIASSSGNDLQLSELAGPSGDQLLESVSERSTGAEIGQDLSVFGFPTLQGSVSPGTYTARYQITTRSRKSPRAAASVSLKVLTKRDADLSSGVLPVNIILVGAVSGSESLMKGLEAAIEIWGEIYSRKGISLDIQFYSFDGARKLPDPREGSSFYAQITALTRPHALNMVIGIDLDGATGQRNENFGIVGGIPGAAISGPRSVAVLSIVNVAGEDGRFNFEGPGATQLWKDEILVCAEALAQLSGNYLGLQQVVTFQGDKVISSDRLADTESCITEVECENEDDPRDNFMFPRVYKRPGKGDQTYARDQMTEQQAALLQRSILLQ